MLSQWYILHNWWITLNRNWLLFKTCFEFLLFALLAKKVKVALFFYGPYSHGFVIMFMSCLLHQIWMLIRQVYCNWFIVGLILVNCVCLFSSDISSFQVYRYLDFVASLLEHPRAKVLCFFILLLFFVFCFCYCFWCYHTFFLYLSIPFQALLLKEGAIRMLTRVLDRCLATADTDGTPILAGRSSAKSGFPVLSWCLPVFKSFSLISISHASLHKDLWVDNMCIYHHVFYYLRWYRC